MLAHSTDSTGLYLEVFILLLCYMLESKAGIGSNVRPVGLTGKADHCVY